MLNDIGTEMKVDEVAQMSREVSNLSEEDLHRTLSQRLGMEEAPNASDLDNALAFVEEPEILSKDDGEIGSAPDLSHADGADSEPNNL